MEDVMEAMAGFYSLFFGPSEAYNKERRETWYQLWGSLLPGEQFKRYVFGVRLCEFLAINVVTLLTPVGSNGCPTSS